MHLVLASASPRRRALLAALGAQFEVCPADVDETPRAGETPLETQQRITREKARRAQCAVPLDEHAIIIACDTTVLLDGIMLNKPTTPDEARAMLRALRGRAHQVQSTLVVRRGEQETLDVVVSTVTMRAYSEDEIERYIASGDPFDKAGGYAVQHALFRPVAHIRGCPLNVVGLPLCFLRARLPFLADPAPLCAQLFGAPCPAHLGDPNHVVSGEVRIPLDALP